MLCPQLLLGVNDGQSSTVYDVPDRQVLIELLSDIVNLGAIREYLDHYNKVIGRIIDQAEAGKPRLFHPLQGWSVVTLEGPSIVERLTIEAMRF